MMRPAIGIRLSSDINAGGFLFIVQSKGNGNIYFRAFLRLTSREKRDKGKVVPVGKRNLGFLHFDVYIPDICKYSIF